MVDTEALASRREEVQDKLERLRGEMLLRRLDALHLTRSANTAWLTAGAATYVDESIDTAACSLFITPDSAVVLTDPIEEPRLREEEHIDALGFDVAVEPWYARGGRLASLSTGKRIGVDTVVADRPDDLDMGDEFSAMRSLLTAPEQRRLREGARLATGAMWDTVDALTPGMSEFEAAGLLAEASRRYGGVATVILVGADERIARYRHPLPTEQVITEQVMLVLCFRYRGLVTALTRTVYFGAVPDALRQVVESVARVDAQVIAATEPGRTLGEMFDVLRAAYAREGVPEAIEQHHQGGTIAYLARETLARPNSPVVIELGQAFAWNPSIRGAKSEDTVILTPSGCEIISEMERWPTLEITTQTRSVRRPVILERH